MTAPTFQLRAWQAECIPIALQAIEEGRKGVVSAVMGAGKSILIREIVRRYLELPGKRELGPVVVTTPSVALVDQLGDTLGESLPVGKFYTHRKQAHWPVVVCCNASARALAATWGEGKRAGLWIADEAHKSEAEGILEAVDALNPHARLAVTATPYRSEDNEKISLFDEELFIYTPADALRDGVIVPWRIVNWDGESVTLDEACIDLIERYRCGPGIVNAKDIDDAEAFAARLCERGIASKAIHSHLSPHERKARLDALKGGELATLVHVSLLVEGVDFPWLRWLCLRRPVGAKVRFVQEVGRVLRADRNDPSKTEALILDPLDLFETFGLTYAAALGWYEPAPPGEPREEKEGEGEEEPQAREERRVHAKGEVSAWIRQLVLALQAEGVMRQTRMVRSGEWRAFPPSEKQVVAARKMAWVKKYLPAEHGRTLAALLKSPGWMSRGLLSDLLDVAHALADREEPWTPEVDIPVPGAVVVKEAGQETEADRQWACAGVLAYESAAVVVRRGMQVVFAKARPWRAGDSAAYLQEAALQIAQQHAQGAPILEGDEITRGMARQEARKLWNSRGSAA